MPRKVDPHTAHTEVAMIHDVLDRVNVPSHEVPTDPKSHEMSSYDRVVWLVAEVKSLRAKVSGS